MAFRSPTPRKGTETNTCLFPFTRSPNTFRSPTPRKGTETLLTMRQNRQYFTFRSPTPRKGTETSHLI